MLPTPATFRHQHKISMVAYCSARRAGGPCKRLPAAGGHLVWPAAAEMGGGGGTRHAIMASPARQRGCGVTGSAPVHSAIHVWPRLASREWKVTDGDRLCGPVAHLVLSAATRRGWPVSTTRALYDASATPPGLPIVHTASHSCPPSLPVRPYPFPPGRTSCPSTIARSLPRRARFPVPQLCPSWRLSRLPP